MLVQNEHETNPATWLKETAASRDEYMEMDKKAGEELLAGNYEQAYILAKEAIALAPDLPFAYGTLTHAAMHVGDNLTALKSSVSLVERHPPGELEWAVAMVMAAKARELAACGSTNAFCECDACAALPEKPEWMASPQALVATAKRGVAIRPDFADAWRMHGSAHELSGDLSAAARSFTTAARLFGDKGDDVWKSLSLNSAQHCRDRAEAVAKAAAEAEAVRMAPIMAAREAAADAAMEALLAEEAKEKEAAKPRKGNGKAKGRRKKK